MIRLKNLLKESKRVKWLFEQQEQDFPIQDLETTFINNYVVPDMAKFKVEIQPTIDQIKALIEKNWTLDQLQIKIESGASKLSATNRYELSEPPNHNFQTVGVDNGGLLPTQGWVPKAGTPYNATTGWVKIPKGNAFLAKTRGDQLKTALTTYLKSQQLAIPTDFILIDTGVKKDKKFVSVSLKTKATFTPEPETIPWDKEGLLWNLGGGDEIMDWTKEGGNNGTIRTFNKMALAKTSPQGGRVGSAENVRLASPDFGRGPGVSVYFTREMMKEWATALGAKAKRWMWDFVSHGGDPVDLEFLRWNNYQYQKQNPNQMAPSKYKNNVPNQKDFKYINVADGSIKPGIIRPIKTPGSSPATKSGPGVPPPSV